MAIFSELDEIPQSVNYRVNVAEKRLDQIAPKKSSSRVLVREIESDLLMSVTVAQAVVDWLNVRIKEARALTETTQSGTASPKMGRTT